MGLIRGVVGEGRRSSLWRPALSNKHSSGFFPLEHRGLWEILTITLGFTAILCWWVAIAGISNTRSAESAVFVVVPILATAAALVSLHHASCSRAGRSLS